MADRENQDMHQHPMWSMHRFIIVRIFLAILILGIVFHVGMQVGELKGMIEAGGYGGHHQMFGRNGGDMFYKQMPAPAAVQAPAAGTKATNTNATPTK